MAAVCLRDFWLVYLPALFFHAENFLPLLSVLINLLLPLTLIGIPTAITIAILRYHVFEIDVIICRTLIYSAVTVSLGAVYLFSIVLLQGFFQLFTGQHQPPLATVLSTLTIAAFFNPLRRRIQNDIDCRFYRRKYDAEKMLKQFSLTVRNEVEIGKLSEHLTEVVVETIEPQSFSLWIRKT